MAKKMSISEGEILRFLEDCGWHTARRNNIPADWSSRYYIRLDEGTNKAILLVSPPDHDPKSVAGHKLGDLIMINMYLADLGLSVPNILAMDEGLGLVLMEDFGTNGMEKLPEKQKPQAYEEATRLLCRLRVQDVPDRLRLIDYYDGHVYRALSFLPEFYIEHVTGTAQTDQDIKDYTALWDSLRDALPPCPRCFTHIDYMAENLIWLDDREGVNRIGVLDYQGAVIAPFTYDLVNLLEDARRIIPHDVKEACKQIYKAELSTEEAEAFDLWYPVMAAQFHARVLGQIVKLSKVNDRNDLMMHKQRLEDYLKVELQNPALAEIKGWLVDKGVPFLQ